MAAAHSQTVERGFALGRQIIVYFAVQKFDKCFKRTL
jgi:hypothetical protein